MKKIYYIGFYSDKNPCSNRKTAPSADTKMDYVLECLNSLGYEVEIISFCEENIRNKFLKKYNDYDIKRGNNKIHFFKTYTSKYRILRVFGRYLTWISQKKYIKQNCINKNCKIIIYHSLLLLKLIKFLNKNNKDFILEMEEIYADVNNRNNARKKELKYVSKASGYIFPTNLLDKEINKNKKPSIVIYGTYKVEEVMNNRDFEDEKIHCVYAGTFDSKKGSVDAAINVAKYLSEKYHVHILGFGTAKQIADTKQKINEFSKKNKAKITYDGLLTGDEYIRFIQKCDIGLSTQNPDAAFNNTSFPSKILSYMANGLRVVSIKIPVIEQSDIGNYMYYYERQTPEEIAKIIMSVDLNDNYDGKKVIKELDSKTKKKIGIFIENIKEKE